MRCCHPVCQILTVIGAYSALPLLRISEAGDLPPLGSMMPAWFDKTHLSTVTTFIPMETVDGPNKMLFAECRGDSVRLHHSKTFPKTADARRPLQALIGCVFPVPSVAACSLSPVLLRVPCPQCCCVVPVPSVADPISPLRAELSFVHLTQPIA